jgi:hypothetical protein
MEHEVERVLLTSLNNGDISPRVSLCGSKTHIDYDAMLSRGAAAKCRDDNLIMWWCSLFGDEIYLTDKGKAVVMRLFDDGTAKFLSEDTWE